MREHAAAQSLATGTAGSLVPTLCVGTSLPTLRDDYVSLARPIIERRLAQAGVRLANELNALLR